MVHLYLSPAVLLLMVMGPLRQLSQALPVKREAALPDQCVPNAQMLLRNITETLSKKDLFKGINCEMQGMELNDESQTVTVCTPQGAKCSATMKSEFNKESCLRNISADLHHYHRLLSAQPDLNTTVLSSVKELMQTCFAWNSEFEEVKFAGNHQNSYDGRLKLCKVLRGFQVRTITINRALQYIKAGVDSQ